MASLQKTIHYEDGQLPVPVRLEFSLPVFRYSEVNIEETDTGSLAATFYRREIVDRISVAHTVKDNKYSVHVPDEALFDAAGLADRSQYYSRVLLEFDRSNRISIDELSFMVRVDVFQDKTNIGYTELEVIDYPIRDQQDGVYRTIFINRQAYTRLIDVISGVTGAVVPLWFILPALVVKSPKGGFRISDSYYFDREQFLSSFEKYLRDYFLTIEQGKRKQYLADIPNIMERVKAFDLSSLFDFPLTIPKVPTPKAVRLAGTFTIDTGSPESVTGRELSFYDLTLEYYTGLSARVQSFGWDLTLGVIGNEPVPFSFEVQDFVEGDFTLRVRGVNGAVLWLNNFAQDAGNLEQIHIRVPFMRPNTLNPAGSGGSRGGKKLRGQIVQSQKGHSPAGVTIVIQALKDESSFWRIVGATETDGNGNFSVPYPYGNYARAQALVSLMPDHPADIEIRPDKENETISDDFLYLLVSETPASPAPGTEDDCDCHHPKKAKRLPDQADLIESDEYTQDMGGGCMNLSTPNRTLREYNYQAIVRISDPDVANYELEKIEESDGQVRYRLRGGNQMRRRGDVNLENPIRWQDSPDSDSNLSIYQAVTVATGHILHYKSVFKADGYSLGELLYSLPLAPGQKKQIVIFDSSHSLTGAETQVISQGESLAASLVNDRTITDQLGGNIAEALEGRSSATTSGISAGLGLGGSTGAISGVLGVSGGYANANSSASQNSSRNISQFFGERLRQSIMQNAESYRQLNASVISTVREGQQYAVTTEVVANHNHCHALTMMYFEVLRHFAIYQELSHVEECVFVPLLMTNFTVENITKWKDVLALHLLPLNSDTYLQPQGFLLRGRQHPLLKAFDAAERVQTDWRNVDYPPEGMSYADETMQFITGQMNLRVHIPRPKTRYDRILSFPRVEPKQVVDAEATVKKGFFDSMLAGITGGISTIFTGPPLTQIQYRDESMEKLVREKIVDQYISIDAGFINQPPARSIRIISFQPKTIEINQPVHYPLPGSPGGNREPISGPITTNGEEFFADGIKDKEQWQTYAQLLGYRSVYDMLDYYFAGRLIVEWDEIFNNDILPLIFEKLIDAIRIDTFNLDFSALSKYKGGNQRMTVRFRGAANKSRKQVGADNTTNISISDPVIRRLKDHVTLRLEDINLGYSTAHYNGQIFRGYVGDDLLDNIPLHTPLNEYEKRIPRDDDRFLVSRLIQHLNSNLEHYNKTLWLNLDPDRRYMLLDGFHIQTYSDFGNPLEYRSLASVVKNQLVAITGNAMVFPVADGYRVSRSYILESQTAVEGATEAQVTLLDHYKPLTPLPPYRISVPTRGVFLEAIPGVCDSCEKVKPNSSQDWDKFRTEEPTPIAPVVTPTPTVTDWRAAFKDFAQPLVSIQNAPATPAPGAGLAGLSELLGKAGVFNDITGLQGNQENAMRTYLSNQENVRALAEMAKTMAMQDHNTRNSGGIMNSINEARESGAISPEDQARLTRQHLQQQIDGGETEREQARTEREQTRPSLTEAAIEAAGAGRQVSAQRTDADGNVESVDIGSEERTVEEGGNGSADGQVDVEYAVPALRQRSENACWATAATMMVNSKNRTNSPVETVLRSAGANLMPPDEDRYLTLYNENQQLQQSEKGAFIEALGLVGEGPASYPLERFIDLLRTYGPLWITTDSDADEGFFSAHARVLRRISGNASQDPDNVRFYFIDPASGQEVVETFREFIVAYEQMVIDDPDPSQPLFIQIVRFRERQVQVSRGEGVLATPPGPQQASSLSTNELRNAYNYALLCKHVYGEGGALPDGYQNLTQDRVNDLIRSSGALGQIQALDDPQTGFNAGVYHHTGRNEYVLVFRGTNVESVEDWRTNYQQGVSHYSPQHEQAMNLAMSLLDALRRMPGTQRFVICGHSLGGGLAAACAMLTGAITYTFNSAGVHRGVYSSPTRIGRNNASVIRAYYIRGEVLSTIQDGLVNASLRTALSGYALWAAVLSAVSFAARPALGRRIELQPTIPLPANPVEMASRAVELHAMDSVLNSFRSLLSGR